MYDTLKMDKPKILHIITDLNTGGAENMLYKLVRSSESNFEHIVISLKQKGTVGPYIEQSGAKVHALGLRTPASFVLALRRLKLLVCQIKPDIYQGWMYHGNEAALLCHRWFYGSPVIWNIRYTPGELANEKYLTRFLIKRGARQSHKINRAIYNADTSRRRHLDLGYSEGNAVIIPNGFDIENYTPDRAKGVLRDELAVDEQDVIIGMVARYHPMKNYEGFVRAASDLFEQYNRVHVVCIGSGLSKQQAYLGSFMDSSNASRLHIFDDRRDVDRLLPDLDGFCLSSSWGEGFPNAVGEAMSCGVPCVVTNVGDTADVVGDTGWVVAPDDIDGLAKSLQCLVDAGPQSRQRLGELARRRVIERFSLDAVVEQYHDLYSQVLRVD